MPETPERRYCVVPGCSRVVWSGKGEFCPGHRKQLERHGHIIRHELTRQATGPWPRLVEAALSLADCDSEADGAWTHACWRLRRAARFYAGLVEKKKEPLG